MTSPSDFTGIDYLAVARQRFEDARVLLRNLRTTGALYMAHYAVEGSLKQLLLSKTRPSRRSSLKRFFHGSTGHDLVALRKEIGKKTRIARRIKQHLLRINTGFTALRYTEDAQTRHVAQAILSSVEAVLAWVEKELS